VHAGGAEVERYWEPDVRVGVSGTLGELAEETRRLTEQALVRRGTVHGPLALQLSGGLDSSSLVGVATRLSRSTSSPLPEVVAVSALYPGMACDETPFIRAVVEHTGVRWCGFDCSAGPTPDSIRRQIAERHEPVDSSDGPGGEEIRGWLRDIGASVLITGQGGDGLFATESTAVQDLLSPRRWRELAAFERGRFGDRHRAWAIDIAKNGLWRRLPSPVQHGVRRLTGRPTRPSWIPADRHRAWRAASARSQPTWRLPAAHGAARRRRDNTWFGHQALHLEEMDGTPGIELRHPYFDVDLVEFVARIDEQQHHTGQFSRVLQRAAFADDLPHVVRERRNKAEFSARLLAGAESHVEGVPEFDHLRRSGHVVPGALEALVGANRTLLATSPSAPGIALYSLTQALASEQFLAWYEGLRATGGSCSLDQDLTR
jgi:asparagine synthase (glutamine-hydrolysing)